MQSLDLEDILAELIEMPDEEVLVLTGPAKKRWVFTGCCTNNYTGYGG
jgi:hypothetical protein